MSDILISAKHNDARLAGGGTLQGISGGTLEVWSPGTTLGNEMPTTAEAAPPDGALKLCTFNFGSPGGVLTSHALVIVPPPDALILVSGNAYWTRWVDEEDDVWMVTRCKAEGDTGTVAAVVLSQLTLYLGGSVRFISGVIG